MSNEIRKRASIRRFGGDRSGNFAVVTGVVASVLMLAVGFAANVAQLYNIHSGLGHALDAAVTSTARDITTGKIAPNDARGMVELFLKANADAGLGFGDRVVLDSLVVDQSKNTVEATAYVDADLFFPLFGMDDTRRVANESAALYSDKKIEIAMMLDVTGSMTPNNKLRDLKKAAKNAVATLLNGQNAKKPRVRIALVPYANAVNAGDLADKTVFVERRASDRGEAPGNDDPRVIAASSGRPDNCATERKGGHQYTDAGPDVAMVNRDYLLTRFARDFRSRACPRAAVVPLTADAGALSASIDDFVAEGGTAGHIGVQWAWYMLSEKWSRVFDASERPEKLDSKVAKYAILMTDGEFNLSYFDAERASQVYNDRGKEPTRTAAKRLCREMRAQGIEIFTIGFRLENRDAKETMADCASADTGSVRHYFDTANGEELDAAFQEIARNIERLAITK